MFSFLKKLFGISDGSSDLMERARNSAMADQTGSSIGGSYGLLGDQMDEEEMRMNQLMDQNHQDELMRQQMQDMHDPYLNPGQDIVVDESYHGIDHGMDDSFHHHDY